MSFFSLLQIETLAFILPRLPASSVIQDDDCFGRDEKGRAELAEWLSALSDF